MPHHTETTEPMAQEPAAAPYYGAKGVWYYHHETPAPQASTKEGELDVDVSNPSFLATLPVGGFGGFGHAGAFGLGHRRGLEGKDAVLIAEVADANRDMFLHKNIDDNGRDNIVQTLGSKYDNAIQILDNKFWMEKEVKNVEIQAEKLAREQQFKILELKSELEKEIAREGDKTRDLIRDQAAKEKDHKLLLLELKQLCCPCPEMAAARARG